MRMNTKGRLAVNAIMDVAINGSNTPVPLIKVSQRQQISVSYLERLFKRFRERGLVSATRGPGGGYRLKHPLSAITVADVVTAVDDDDIDSCTCPAGSRGEVGQAHDVWCRLGRHLHEYLGTVTLKSLLEDKPEQVHQRIEVPEFAALSTANMTQIHDGQQLRAD